MKAKQRESIKAREDFQQRLNEAERLALEGMYSPHESIPRFVRVNPFKIRKED